MAKYNYDFKVKVVEEYLDGKGSYSDLARKFGVARSLIRLWVNIYRNRGKEALKRSRKNKSYSVEFKLETIIRYETSELSLFEVANERGITNPAIISNWARTYKESGLKGLSRKGGRQPSVSNMAKEKMSDAKIKYDLNRSEYEHRIEILEKENEMLRIRNEYLEQLRSLRAQKQMKK